MITSISKKQNILLIMSDQHNANAIGYTGNSEVKTPNLDSLAADGVTFSNAFCNNPICAPTRTSFITGQYVHTHGLGGNDNRSLSKSNEYTLGSVIKNNGYETAFIGKSHTVPKWDKESYDFLKYNGFCDADYDDPLTCHYLKYLHDHNLSNYCVEGTENKKGFPEAFNGSAPFDLADEHSVEHYTGEMTLDFLKNRDDSKPFFVTTSFLRPHDPYTPSSEYFGMYDPNKITLPENMTDSSEGFTGKPRYMQNQAKKSFKIMDDEINRFAFTQNSSDPLKRVVASYYGLISANDYEIGRIIDYLKEIGEYENTIIVYTSDHGDFAGEHGLMGKCFSIYDAIHRIPFIIKYPGCQKGQTCENIIESIDLYPTLAKLIGISVPDFVDGISFIADGRLVDNKDEAYCEANNICAVRTQDYRLIYHNGYTHELYDYTNDPGELFNVYNHPDYNEIQTTLYKKLNQNSYIVKDTEDHSNSLTTLIHKKGYFYSEIINKKPGETTPLNNSIPLEIEGLV